MYATQDLRDEHEGIKVALAVLDRLANDVESGASVDIDDIEQLIDFLKTFADRCHHGKEEDLLFPALEQAGIQREGGPIGVMLTDHTHGRDYIRVMSESISGLRLNDPTAAKALSDAAHGYVRLLNDHIAKENTVLFVMAEQHLPSEVHLKLKEGFDRIEQERIGPGVHERYHEMLNQFQDKYLTSSD